MAISTRRIILILLAATAVYFAGNARISLWDRDATALLRCLLASGYLVALIAIIQSVVTNLATVPGTDTAFAYGGVLRAFATFGNPNFLGVFFAMLLPVAIHELLHSTTWASRLLFANVLVVMVLALLLTFSRSAWLAAGVALLALLLASGRRGRLAAVGALLTLALFAGLLLATRPAQPSSASTVSTLVHRVLSITESGGSTRSRIGVWEGSLRVIVSRPLTGYGPDTFGIVYPRYRTGDWAPGYLIDKAHNEVLQLAATEGAFGVAAYVWLIAAMAVAFWHGRGRSTAVAVAAGISAYLLWVEVNFSFIPAAAVFWLFAAPAVVIWSAPLPQVSLHSALPRRTAIAGAVALSLAAAALILPAGLRALIADDDLYASIQAHGRGDQASAVRAASEAQRLVPNQSLYAAQAGSLDLELDGNGNPGPGPDWAAGAEAYRAAVQAGTDNPRLYFYLALSEQKLGQFEQATDDARAGLSLNPGDPGLSALLGQLLAQTSH